MATWGVEARIAYRAWNTSNNAGVAGDSANHTLTLRREGTDSAFVGTVNDLGNGVYEAVVSGTLAESYELAMRGTSATADVVLFFEAPVRPVNTLTPEQATWIEETHAKAMLIGTGGAFVEVINPVSPGGKITLYSGYDYTSGTTPISLPGATVDDGTAVTLHAVPDRYGDDGEPIDLTGVVSGDEYVLEATRAQIPASRAGQYRYQVWADDGGDHALLAAGTLVIARGK